VIWLWVVIAIVLLGGVAVVASGQGDAMRDVHDDRPDSLIPRYQRLTSADIRAVRFSTGFRGYRMDEVDALLARVEAELAIISGDEERPPPPDEPDAANPAAADAADDADDAADAGTGTDADSGYPHS
jgi:DivIVA domain-containing protein